MLTVNNITQIQVEARLGGQNSTERFRFVQDVEKCTSSDPILRDSSEYLLGAAMLALIAADGITNTVKGVSCQPSFWRILATTPWTPPAWPSRPHGKFDLLQLNLEPLRKSL